LHAEAEDHTMFVVAGTARPILLRAMINQASSCRLRHHETKHDGYRLIVRRDGRRVRPYTRNAYDWTLASPMLPGGSKAKTFTIDGETVVLGPDGLSLFDELRRPEAAHAAMIYAFDLIGT
jgi:ATP-dependent DNA ligase